MKKLITKHKRVITITLVLIIYFLILTAVSYVKSTDQKAVGESLVSYQDFMLWAKEGRAWVDEAGLHFNDSENTGKVFYSAISLKDLQQIQVHLIVDCPAEYAEKTALQVDLYADGYDNPEQEFSIELKAGENDIIQVIDKGNQAPDEAQFRIYCLEAVHCDVRNLSVQKIGEVSYQERIGVCIVVLVVLAILLIGVIALGKEKNGQESQGIRFFALKEKKSIRDRFKCTKGDLETILYPAIFLSLTFFVFGPIEIYITNITELWFSVDAVLLPSILAGVICCGMLLLVGFLIPVSGRKWYSCVLIGLGIGLYIQGNFIQTSYGVLDGREIQWENYRSVTIWNTVLWIACLIIPIIAQKILKNKFKNISSMILCCVALVEIITLGVLVITTDFSKSYNKNNAYLSSKNLYTISSEKNVIVFVLDTFDQQFMEEILGERPDILDSWEGFTYYTNATCGYPTTKGSLPFMLTGQYYKNEQPYNDYVKKAYQSIDFYEELWASNYEINLYTGDIFVSDDIKTYLGNAEVGEVYVNSYIGLEQSMLQFTAFRYFPHILKQFVWFYSGMFDQFKSSNTRNPPRSSDNISFYSGLKTEKLQTTSGKNVYSFIHLDGTHEPLTLNEDVTKVEKGTATVITQGIACINIVQEYITQLKNLGVYNDTTIIVTADHGSNILRWPIFLVKGFNSSGPIVQSDVPISHEAIIPTIMEECGLNSGHKYGTSAKEILESTEIERTYLYYSWDNSWDKNYLPDMTEYKINSQKRPVPTGIMYTSRGTETVTPYKYQIGSDIKFTYEDDGCRYFTEGISVVETDFAWSLGKTAQMILNVGENISDLNGEFLFRAVYAAPQRLVVCCDDLILYDEIVTSAEEPIRFAIPEECIKNGMLVLNLKYPDAISGHEFDGGAEYRVLAFAFTNIRFDSIE